MEKIILLSNIGSASKKYSIYLEDDEIAWFHFEKMGDEFLCSYKINSAFEKKHITNDMYISAISEIINLLQKSKTITNEHDISSVALRVVVPYFDFSIDTICTPKIFEKLKEFQVFDPLHIDPVITEVELAYSVFGSEVMIYFISDSSFHISNKRKVPLLFKEPIFTIGYHGLSCESVLTVLKQKNIEYSKMIVAHLGGGSSVSAISNDVSVYNSMEVSPLSGILMSSRPGSIDPFAILLYMKEHAFTYEETLMRLYTESGLKVLSGVSGDLRIIREEAFKGNKDAKYAINQFVDSIVSNICKAMSYTQGIDTLVFTGTIGLRASYIREMVLEKLLWLGCVLDHYKNTETSDTCFEISAYNSKIKIYVIQIDEMKEIHTHTIKLLKSKV